MAGEGTAKAFRREIDLGDGSGKQVFEADTAEELADKLADAQVNATRKIRDQDGELKRLRRAELNAPARGEDDPDGPMPGFKPKDLSSDELFSIGQRLQNPATAVAALREAIEAGLGASMDEVRKTLRIARETPREFRGRDAAEQFLLNHPEFVPNAANQKAMFEYMEHPDRRMAVTVKNFEIAFGVLSAAGLLQLRKPEAAGNGNGNGNGATPADSGAGTPEPPSTPRFASTSVATRGSGTPRGETRSKMPTAEEIDKMSAREHAKWLTVPGFMQHEERVLAEQSRRRRG
ncbi:MAG TPA: hypothetical protein VNU44_14520 [Bryobacteraceae bacterium]|jgi:hypothetical protein|nr:hypothetical protein [Bryobacteraceae bacterium]